MPTAGASRATTKSICSTSTIPGPQRAVPGIARTWRRATHVVRGGHARWAGSGCPFATTCAFRSCTADLVARGARWLSMPAAFTVPTGRAHWETLLRARAIENLCYVVAPAQSGHAHERPRNLWRYVDRRLLGPGADAPDQGRRSDHSGLRSGETGGSAGALPGAREPAARRRTRMRRCRHERRAHVRRGGKNDSRALGARPRAACRACSAR